MTITPALLYIWAGLFLSFLALAVYRGHFTRYEHEQLFLDDNGDVAQSNKMQKERIVSNINRIRPVFSVCGVAAVLVTTTVVGIYTYNAWPSIR